MFCLGFERPGPSGRAHCGASLFSHGRPLLGRHARRGRLHRSKTGPGSRARERPGWSVINAADWVPWFPGKARDSPGESERGICDTSTPWQVIGLVVAHAVELARARGREFPFLRVPWRVITQAMTHPWVEMLLVPRSLSLAFARAQGTE